MEQDYNEFAERMESEYPKIFSQSYGGFAVDEGWWPIIEVLCKEIQNHIDWQNKYGTGTDQVIVEQIKEKLGGLRFYYSGGNPYIAGLVQMAENWADRTCERCGAVGKRRADGWLRTLCDQHEQERQDKMKEAKNA